jgi:poly(3-hydroxybutyrate) depolymerase
MNTTMRATILGVVLCAVTAMFPSAALTHPSLRAVRVLAISYRAHDGFSRRAYLILPAWYGPLRHPAIPLVISPHGRGVGARANIRRWGDLPARGSFAVINPEGQGRKLTLFSWGDPGEIRDLARMPQIAEQAVPWLQIDRHRVYAFGGSMGGQETLLLLARFPRLLAGAAAFDAPTNMAARIARSIACRSAVDCNGSRDSRSAGRPPRIRSATRSAAPSTGQGGLRSPECRFRSGGARATGSSATRSTSRACSTVTSSASIQLLPSASSSACGRTQRRWPRTAICRMRSRGSAFYGLARPRPCGTTRVTQRTGSLRRSLQSRPFCGARTDLHFDHGAPGQDAHALRVLSAGRPTARLPGRPHCDYSKQTAAALRADYEARLLELERFAGCSQLSGGAL